MRALASVLAVLAVLGCGAAELPDRVLLVTVDTLRADHLGAYGDLRELTPRLDALARESVRFEHVYAPAPFTLASVGALLTGRHPRELGIRDNLTALPEDLPTLATRLRARGFATGAVVSSLVLKIARPLHAGFETFDAGLPKKERVRWWVNERTAAATTAAALAQIDELAARRPGPIFFWVHYQDPHGPYTPPAGLRDRYLAGARGAAEGRRTLPLTGAAGVGGLPRYQYLAPHSDVGFYRAGYAAEIRHTDTEIGRLLDALSERAGWKDAVVVLTSDHGEALGVRDHWFAHGARLVEGALRVPLLIRAPGLAPAVRSDRASLLDVAPTLAALLGLPPDPAARGRDLFAPGAADAVSSPLLFASEKEAGGARFAVVGDGWKLVRVVGEGERLHRLPDDESDAAGSEPEVARRLSAALDAALAEVPVASSTPGRVSPEEAEGLRALGYLEEDQ